MNLIEAFQELTKNNTKDLDIMSDMLQHYYESASIEEQKIINKICVCLTGVQFDTVLIRAGIEKPHSKIS